MRLQIVESNHVQYIVESMNKLYEHMINNARIDALEMKAFMEPYFLESGYREESSKLKVKAKSQASNILIMYDAGVGDFILMSAVIREIRRIYPKAYIMLLINRFAADMAECCPYVDEIITCKDEVLTKINQFFQYYKNIADVVKPLLRRRIDIAFNFGHYPSSQLLTYFSGAKERVDLGFMNQDFSFDDLSTYQVDWRDFKKSHYNDRFLYILHKYAKAQIANKSLEVWLSPIDRALAIESLKNVGSKKLYAIVPGGNLKLSRKRWSVNHYAELMNMILDEEEAAFALFGGIEDVEASKIIKSSVKAECIIDFADKLNYRQSAAVLNLCDCYIGNDTGLLHAAAALNIPILTPSCFPADKQMTVSSLPALYYPYNVPSVIVQPKQALPECKNVVNSSGCNSDESHCINQITPAKMFEGLKILNKQIAKNIKEPVFYN